MEGVWRGCGECEPQVYLFDHRLPGILRSENMPVLETTLAPQFATFVEPFLLGV
jgi:hypothetical protein